MSKRDNFKRPVAKQLPSGSWFCRVRVDGKDIAITRQTRKAAEAEAMALKYGIVEARQPQKGKETLEQVVDNYIESKRGYLSPSTIREYVKIRRNMFSGLMHRKATAITDAQWQAAIKAEKDRGCAPKYIKNAWGLVNVALKASNISVPKVQLFPPEQNEKPFLDHEEIKTFVEAIKGDKAEIAALLCLSGLRRSEMLALDWANVDLNNQVLYVRGAVVMGEGGLVVKPQNKTTTSRRAVPIIPPLLEALRAAETKEGRVVVLGGGAVLRRVHAICEREGITDVDLHGLRHSMASLAYHLGIPELVCAEIGGWSDLGTMRKIYTHIGQKDIAARGKQLQKFFE